MKAVFGLLALAIIGILVYVASDPSYQAQRETAAWTDAQRQRAAVAAEATQTAITLQQQERVAPVATSVQIGVSISLGIAASLGVLAGVMFCILFLARRLVLVRPSAGGVLPQPLVGFAGLADASRASLAAYHLTEYRRAGIQPVPQTFSPSFTHNPSHTSNGRADELASDPLLDAPPLALPDGVRVADVMDQIKPHCLAFGVDTTGRLLQAPLSQSYHLLSSGRTRSGKSNSLNLVLAQLHYQQRQHGLRCNISVLDYKRELSSIWARSALVDLATTEPGDMVDLLRELVHGDDGLLARQDLFNREGQRRGRIFGNLLDYERGTGETLGRHFICIDELNAVLIAADDKRLGDELAQLLYLGAGAGFFIIGGAHSLDASTFRRAAKEQFSSRLQFGPFDQSAVNLMYGSLKIEPADIALLDGRSGRGLVQLVTQSRPIPFQALQVEEGDMLPFIDQRPDDATAATMHHAAADADAIASTPATGDAPISEALRRAIWTKKRAGLNKADTIFHLWNVRKGGTETYRGYAALYDRVLGEGAPDGE